MLTYSVFVCDCLLYLLRQGLLTEFRTCQFSQINCTVLEIPSPGITEDQHSVWCFSWSLWNQSLVCRLMQ